MELQIDPSAEIPHRTLRDENRKSVDAWLDRLKNWNHDSKIRKLSDKLPGMDVYVLRATDGFRIFFRKDEESITILDIATKETIDLFAGME